MEKFSFPRGRFGADCVTVRLLVADFPLLLVKVAAVAGLIPGL